MTEYDNTNRGGIWKNDKKREGKQDADFTGSLDVDGVQYWVNAWKRKEDANPKAAALSFTIRRKEQQPEAPESITERAMAAMKRPAGASNVEMNDDIPF